MSFLWRFFLTVLLCAKWVVAFNPRITCSSNLLINTQRYIFFKSMLLRDPALSPLRSLIVNDEKSYQGYGRVVTPNISLLNQSASQMGLSWCKNIIMNQESCCPSSKFASLASNVNKAYNIVLNNTQYHIVRYARNLTLNLNNNNCSYSKAEGPETSAAFISLINNYSLLMKKIEMSERSFINQTLCIVCMGTKDYANFMNPNLNYPQYPDFNNFMYERHYFTTRVNQLTATMLSLEALHNNLTALIVKLGRTISSSQPACLTLKAQSTNSTFLQLKKICTDTKSCKKIVAKYFGQLLTPQLLYYINRISSNQPMIVVSGAYAISENPNFGFKGNVTYQSMYGYRYMPNVTIYNDTNQYLGLY